MPLASSQFSVAAREPARSTGEEDDLVILGEALHDRDTLGMRRVVRRGGEEGIPILGTSLDVVQAVAHVGDDTVDVDDGEGPFVGHVASSRS